MKAVIDGKLYDTDKAEEVAGHGNGYARSDFHYCEEVLYRTAKGNWFLQYEGGALSGYGESIGNERHGSAGLRALDEGEAFEWLQQHGEVDAILARFPGRVEEA